MRCQGGIRGLEETVRSLVLSCFREAIKPSEAVIQPACFTETQSDCGGETRRYRLVSQLRHIRGRTVVEGIFEGAQAPLSRAGPLSWLERENHEFSRYLVRRLTEE